MGVMGCYRTDCTNIMCDTYIDEVGYICSKCQLEFKDYLKAKNINPEDITLGELNTQLVEFMATISGHHLGTKTTVDDFFDSNTRN